MMLKIRGNDNYGSGKFGASRGSRTHSGVDIITQAGDNFLSLASGAVTKLGYPYAGDMLLRYVQVTTSEGKDYRFFYIKPTVSIGDKVLVGDVIGVCQSLKEKYPNGMTQHCHFEIKAGNTYENPTKVVDEINHIVDTFGRC